ncbi:MAG: HelD family protein [Frankia sp.]
MSTEEIGREQAYVSILYGRLDDLRVRNSTRLGEVLRQTGGTPQARFERDAASARYARTLTAVTAAEHGLCFGRLDFDGGERRYIGRLGILDESADYEPLLIDWRAPAARPYYVATAAARLEVWRRRRITTRQRSVVDLDDDVLNLAGVTDEADGQDVRLIGEAALFATLSAARTGRMSDVVETIQAEQDRIIRTDNRGVLVVQGGPGTGKTAVALHRAAYLVYTYREQLSRSGVLIIGPNATFLRYIENVLPSLGETSVVISTIGNLYPGVEATRTEPPATAEIKGRLAMAEVVATAVRDRQRIPREGALEIQTEDRLLLLERSTCQRARSLARESRRPHNQARVIFTRAVIEALARQVADGYAAETITAEVIEVEPAAAELLAPAGSGGPSLLEESDLEDLRRDLRADPAVRAVLDDLWPVLTPERLLTDLFTDSRALSSAAPELTGAERTLLLRVPGTEPMGTGSADTEPADTEPADTEPADTEPAGSEAIGSQPAGRGSGGGWTVADIPLLDEAAELIGDDDLAAQVAALRDRRNRIAYAQGVLDILARDLDDDPEILMASDMIDADRFADRQEDADYRTVAARALADPAWAFGHGIVDEAQELSQMAWRMVMRRCPSRSMTLVGDVAQTGDPAGTSSWDRVLEPYAAGARPRLETLTLNYRTPSEIMAVAADVLAGLDPPLEPPRSVRATGVEPWRVRVDDPELVAEVTRIAAAEAGRLGDGTGAGRLAVLVPGSRAAEVGAAVRAAVPEAGLGAGARLESPVVVLEVRQAKGLEFDAVLVVDPDRILVESARGANDLYVALTRATRTLGVVHTGPAPAALARLHPRPTGAADAGR